MCYNSKTIRLISANDTPFERELKIGKYIKNYYIHISIPTGQEGLVAFKTLFLNSYRIRTTRDREILLGGKCAGLNSLY